MKKYNYLSINIFLFLFLFLGLSCLEEEETINTVLENDRVDKKEGYLPLSPNMYWYYENYLADLDENLDNWEYRDLGDFEMPDLEMFIPKVNFYTETSSSSNETKNFIEYEMAPIADPGLLGALSGNAQKIHKSFLFPLPHLSLPSILNSYANFRDFL